MTLLACLASNAIAVPLAPSFPAAELRYILNHSAASLLLSTPKFAALATEVLSADDLETPPTYLEIPKTLEGAAYAESRDDDFTDPVVLEGDEHHAEGGMMLYTSGTTARPKGVLLPTLTLAAQARSLIEAWQYTPKDRLLHVLPLHHIHGTVNALLTPLLAGGTIEFLFPFNVEKVWERFASPFLAADPDEHQPLPTPPPGAKVPINFFTVVPTVWARLLATHSALPPRLNKASSIAITRQYLRLNISGSAALPTPTKKAWNELSDGNVLLERFGMTEVGMALSCGLHDSDRVDGSVGWPLPGVEARLVDPDTHAVIPPPPSSSSSPEEKEISGEIQLRGPTIFKSYWRNPEATAKEFTPDGWFKTGDIAIRKHLPPPTGTGLSGAWATGPAFFIHGRASADIIKTGGEKVSALEIEREILSLPQIAEAAVVGLPSETWGQKVAVVVVLSDLGKTAGKGGKAWGVMDLRRALKGVLVAYKIPQDMKVVEAIPRNAMGKVNKKSLVPLVFGDQERIRRRSVLTAEEKALEKVRGEAEAKKAREGEGK